MALNKKGYFPDHFSDPDHLNETIDENEELENLADYIVKPITSPVPKLDLNHVMNMKIQDDLPLCRHYKHWSRSSHSIIHSTSNNQKYNSKKDEWKIVNKKNKKKKIKKK